MADDLDTLRTTVRAGRSALWANPDYLPGADVRARQDLDRARGDWTMLAPLLARVFPELAASGGRIASDLIPVPEGAFGPLPGRVLIKGDHALPVAGSIKARGGIFEVFMCAVTQARAAGLLGPDDPVTELAGAQEIAITPELDRLIADSPELISLFEVQRDVFDSNRALYEGQTSILRERISQLRQQLNQMRIQISQYEIARNADLRSENVEQRRAFQERLELGAVRRDYVYMTGEVRATRRTALPFESRSNLADILLGGGGLNIQTADYEEIYVLRQEISAASPGGITAFHLDASNAASLTMATLFEMRPNDIVFVAEQPVTSWGRVINQIVPNLISQAASVANAAN